MHEYLKEAREGAERKLKGIQKGEPHTKVDSSSWSPPDMLEADKQNGMRPVSKRQYKSGGKVEGAHAKKRADRKARKEGGRAMSVDGFINRDNKLANDEREGVKKIGGMKRGGKIKREHHADGDAVGDLIRQDQIEQGMKGRGLPMRVPMPPRRPKASAPSFKDPIPNSASPTYKKGGAAHPDVAKDKALIRKMVKPSARTGKAEGGEKKENITLKKMPSGAQQYTRGDTHRDRADLLNELGYNQAINNSKKASDMIWNNAFYDEIKDWDKDINEGRYSEKRGGRTKRDEHRIKRDLGGAATDYDYQSDNPKDDLYGKPNQWLLYKMGVEQERKLAEDPSENHGQGPTVKEVKRQQNKNKGGRAEKCWGGKAKAKKASGGEAGRGLYVRQGYPHEVPGADGGRTAKKGGGSLGKGKTNVNIMIHPHSGMSQPPVMPPMGGPMVPPPPPRPQMPPMGGMPMGAPMGGGPPPMPPMGAGRPGMPPIGRKNGGKIPAGMKTRHVIDNAAGGGLGRLEKIKAYGLD